MTSEAYNDLGGRGSFEPRRAHQHRYDPMSGWCRCGRRDDGRVAEGSPAWAARRTEAR